MILFIIYLPIIRINIYNFEFIFFFTLCNYTNKKYRPLFLKNFHIYISTPLNNSKSDSQIIWLALHTTNAKYQEKNLNKIKIEFNQYLLLLSSHNNQY